MKTQLSEFKKIIFILSIRKLDLIKILVLILIASLTELLGLSIVIPFISNTFNLSDKEYFNFLNQGDLTTYEIQSILLGILLFVFFFKAIISIFIKWYIGVFSSRQNALLQKKLITLYQNMDYEDYVEKNNSEYVRNIREIASDCLSNLDLSLKVIAEVIVFFFIIL